MSPKLLDRYKAFYVAREKYRSETGWIDGVYTARAIGTLGNASYPDSAIDFLKKPSRSDGFARFAEAFNRGFSNRHPKNS